MVYRPQCLPETRIPRTNPLKRLTRRQRNNIPAIAGIRHTTGTISSRPNPPRRPRARGDKPDQYAKEHYGHQPPRARGNPPRSPDLQNRTGQPVSAPSETNLRLIRPTAPGFPLVRSR